MKYQSVRRKRDRILDRTTVSLDRTKTVVKPKTDNPSAWPVQPIIDAVSPSIKREGYGKASSTVTPIPKLVRPIREPLPNCPDGRYRPLDVDGYPLYED